MLPLSHYAITLLLGSLINGVALYIGVRDYKRLPPAPKKSKKPRSKRT